MKPDESERLRLHVENLEAEVERLKTRIADYEDDYRATLVGPCDDEQHCACIPHLGRRIGELEAEVERLKVELLKANNDGALLQDELAEARGQIVVLKHGHTWENERAAIVEWLIKDMALNYPIGRDCILENLTGPIERGEHWSPGKSHDL
jgi:uncharacterized small protein (DUF1192 family)